MNPLLLLGSIFLVPILLVLVLRANAALVFLSLCAGNVLQLFVGDDTQTIIQGLFNNYSVDIGLYIRLVLLFVPPFLTILFLKSGVRGAKNFINIVPATTVGIASVFLAVPLLPGSLKSDIYGTSVWSEIAGFQAILIGLSVSICLIIVLTGKKVQHRKASKKHG